MANIVFDNLEKPKNVQYKKQFTYADLKLDLKFDQVKESQLYSSVLEKDIVGSYDLGAIENSIVNIFTTFPGDKILNPNFGLNLNQFLFVPVNFDTAKDIGDTIKNQIRLQENRVKVKLVEVLVDEDNQQYDINLTLAVPFINNNSTLNIRAALNSTGITFYN
jgi:phage baseplate assembly protein W